MQESGVQGESLPKIKEAQKAAESLDDGVDKLLGMIEGVKRPQNIAVVGAPGSGKTEFSMRLRQKSEKEITILPNPESSNRLKDSPRNQIHLTHCIDPIELEHFDKDNQPDIIVEVRITSGETMEKMAKLRGYHNAVSHLIPENHWPLGVKPSLIVRNDW